MYLHIFPRTCWQFQKASPWWGSEISMNFPRTDPSQSSLPGKKLNPVNAKSNIYGLTLKIISSVHLKAWTPQTVCQGKGWHQGSWCGNASTRLPFHADWAAKLRPGLLITQEIETSFPSTTSRNLQARAEAKDLPRHIAVTVPACQRRFINFTVHSFTSDSHMSLWATPKILATIVNLHTATTTNRKPSNEPCFDWFCMRTL